MALIHALAVATTTPGAPRASATASYNGLHDRQANVQLVCPTWATSDPTILIHVEVQQSFDSGTTWEAIGLMDTNATHVNRFGSMPSFGCQVVDDLGPRLARVLLSVENGPLDIGIDLTI